MTSASPPPRHERTRQVVLRLAILALLVSVLVFTGSKRVVASGILPGHNPAVNVVPSPNFEYSGSCSGSSGSWHCANPCVTSQLTFPAFTNGARCVSYVARAIDQARAGEGVGPMVLPSNWFRLSVREQLFVLADLERTARGLPPYLGLNAALDTAAQRAADADADPGLAPGFAVGIDRDGYPGMGGAWASGFTTLGADFGWMYADGWGGDLAATPNLACTSPRAAGCWAHRDELLGYDPRFNPGVGLRCRDCEMGTGFATRHGEASFTDLVELPARGAPPLTFTWARDVLPFLPNRAVVAARERLRHRIEARRAEVHAAWPRWLSRGTALASCHTPGTRRPFGPRACRVPTFKRAGTSP